MADKKLKVIFCLPGKDFSDSFIMSWSDLLADSINRGIDCKIRSKYTSNIYICRSLILRQDDATSGNMESTKPFPDTDYDYLLWIDADMVFEPKDFLSLLRRDRAIVTGLAITGANNGRLNCGRIDTNGDCKFFYKKNLSSIPRNDEGLIEIDFAGFAWLLVKKGVFESIPFPWFRPITRQYGDVIRFPSEDIGWCIQAREAGWQIFADPEVKIGHEKRAILRV